MADGMGSFYEQMFPEHACEAREMGDAVGRFEGAFERVFDALVELRRGVPELVRAALAFRRAQTRLGKAMKRR